MEKRKKLYFLARPPKSGHHSQQICDVIQSKADEYIKKKYAVELAYDPGIDKKSKDPVEQYNRLRASYQQLRNRHRELILERDQVKHEIDNPALVDQQSNKWPFMRHSSTQNEKKARLEEIENLLPELEDEVLAARLLCLEAKIPALEASFEQLTGPTRKMMEAIEQLAESNKAVQHVFSDLQSEYRFGFQSSAPYLRGRYAIAIEQLAADPQHWSKECDRVREGAISATRHKINQILQSRIPQSLKDKAASRSANIQKEKDRIAIKKVIDRELARMEKYKKRADKLFKNS
jgi:hypothetical protein